MQFRSTEHRKKIGKGMSEQQKQQLPTIDKVRACQPQKIQTGQAGKKKSTKFNLEITYCEVAILQSDL